MKISFSIFIVAVSLATVLSPSRTFAMGGDLNADGALSVADVQCAVLSVLNFESDSQPDCLDDGQSADLDCSGGHNVVDIQLLVRVVLGAMLGEMGMPPSADADQDNVHDVCDLCPSVTLGSFLDLNGDYTLDACDDGNAIDGDGCDSNCTPTSCGNGVVTAGELCDDGNIDDGDECTADCTLAVDVVSGATPEGCSGAGAYLFDLCGDGTCSLEETHTLCPADCGPLCGDGTCAVEERYLCVADCTPKCGDGVCNGAEGFEDCAEDCQAICVAGDCDADDVNDVVVPENSVLLSELVAGNEGGDIYIAPDMNVLIDTDATLGLIKVEGHLRCPAEGEFEIRTAGISVSGSHALFECGTALVPFQGHIRFVLTGEVENMGMGIKAVTAMMGGVIRLIGKSARAGFMRLGEVASVGSTSITLRESVADAWKPGDQIVVAVTGFNRQASGSLPLVSQNERRFISSISSDGKTLSFTQPLVYKHFAGVQHYSHGQGFELDESGYVVNLERNIEIVAETDALTENKIGGHLMFMAGARAYFDGVELERMGQMGSVARYPFHWHRAGNVYGQYIRNSSIYDSFQRCVTVHGTQKALVEGNTCFNNFGHAIFLEDGDEEYNRILNNIVIQTLKVPEERALLRSDFFDRDIEIFPSPASYWISNPRNDIRGNVAIASHGTGFWMAFVDEIKCTDGGCTQEVGNAATHRPSATPTWRFDSNVAASCVVGMTWDGAPHGTKINNPNNNSDHQIEISHYAPRENGLPSGTAQTPVFKDLVAYKNSRVGMYLRGEQAIYENAILADNGTGWFCAYNQVLKASLVVGVSDNYDEQDATFIEEPSIREAIKPPPPFGGVIIYLGPWAVDDVHFADFSPEPLIYGEKDYTPVPFLMVDAAEHFTNTAHRVSFSPEPKVRFRMRHDEPGREWFDRYTGAVHDVLGDITGIPGAVMVPDHPFNADPSCISVDESYALACQYKLAQVFFDGGEATLDFSVIRSDGAVAAPPDPLDAPGFQYNKTTVILNQGYSYTVDKLAIDDDGRLGVRFTSESVGDLSPPIHFTNVVGCDSEKLKVPCLPTVDSMTDLENSGKGAVFYSPDGPVIRLQTYYAVNNVYPGTDFPQAELEFVCE